MALPLIDYNNKTDFETPTDADKQCVADDMNQIKDKTNAAITQLNNATTGERYVFTIDLISAGSVAGRIAAPITLPAGWSLAVGASALDLVITHGTGRRVGPVEVYANISGTIQQMLAGTSAYATGGIYSESANVIRIASLATILKPISIYLVLN